MQVKVLGWKFFADAIDGKEIDSGKLFVELPLDESRGNAKGVSAAEIRLPNSAPIKAIKHLPLPALFDLDMAMHADGKGGFRQVCMGAKPVSAPLKGGA